MRALLALALFSCVPARAGVVASVESAVAPAAPTAILPVAAPSGSGLAASILGGADLRGSIPLLPSPVPGLVPALNFVGESPAPSAQPQAAPTATATPLTKPAPTAKPVTAVAAAERTPALPAKPSPGASLPAISRDGDGAQGSPSSIPAAWREGAGDAARPFFDAADLGHSLPETTAGAGRRFFDQSRDKGRGTVADRANANRPADGLSAPAVDGAGLAETSAGSARGSGGVALRAANGSAGARRSGSFVPAEGEVLRDAVAGGPLPAGAAGGAVSFFRAASPNGELLPGRAGAATAPTVEPRALALDLSGAGLIVRVRSAFGAVLPAPAASELPARLPAAASASTAMLERGAMLEAFSVAGAYAGAEPGASREFSPSTLVVPIPARSVPLPSRPATVPASAWWGLLLLPVLGLAARRFL